MPEGTPGPYDEVAAALYGSDPSDFVAERNRRVKELKAADQREVADRVGALRKPTLPAWAVDQVAIHDTDLLQAVLAAGDTAREAQTADDRQTRQDALRDLRTRVGEARSRAAEHLRRIDSDPAGHLEEIEQTLMAAAVDPDQREEVVAGRLTRPLPPPGFAALSGLAVGGPVQAPPEERGDDGERQRRLREVRAALDRLERHRTSAQREVEQAEQRAERLRREADEAADEAAQQRRHLGDVQKEVEDLQRQIKELQGGT